MWTCRVDSREIRDTSVTYCTDFVRPRNPRTNTPKTCVCIPTFICIYRYLYVQNVKKKGQTSLPVCVLCLSVFIYDLEELVISSNRRTTKTVIHHLYYRHSSNQRHSLVLQTSKISWFILCPPYPLMCVRYSCIISVDLDHSRWCGSRSTLDQQGLDECNHVDTGVVTALCVYYKR